jgi:hypothetical protein
VDIVLDLIRRGCSSLLLNTDEIHWGNIESISEAVAEACIIEGLDEDCFSPHLHRDGHETEITLYA